MWRAMLVICGGVVGACAPILTPRDEAERLYEAAKVAEAEARALEARVSKAARGAEAIRGEVGKTYARAVLAEAAAQEALQDGLRQRAEADRQRACELDPVLCVEKFVTVRWDGSGGVERLSSYPSGWKLVQPKDRSVVLWVDDGSTAVVLGAKCPKGCYRFAEAGVTAINCPAE